MFADDLDELRAGKPPKAPPVALVGSLDNLWHLGKLEIDHHAIVAGGARVGVWEFDFDAQKIVWALTTKDKPKGVEQAVAEMEAFARDQLGDVRSFSLDSPESRKPAIAERAQARASDLEDELAEVLAAEELAERLGELLDPLDDVLARLELALAVPAGDLHRRLGVARREVEHDEALHARAVDEQRQVVLRADARAGCCCTARWRRR